MALVLHLIYVWTFLLRGVCGQSHIIHRPNNNPAFSPSWLGFSMSSTQLGMLISKFEFTVIVQRL